MAISAANSLTIEEHASVTAITTSGAALNGGYGITINGGTVTANGGSGSAFSEVTGYINVVPPNGETIAVQYGENINNVQKSTYTEETDIMNTVENYSYFHSYLTNASEPTITGVIVQPETVTVQQGTQHTFAATVTGSGDLSQAKVSWSVIGSDSANAGTSISENGQLTVATDEMAESLTVTASVNDGDTTLSDTAIVTVTKVPVQSITIEPSEITLMAGQTYQLKATVVPPEAGVVTWTSDSSDRVSVDETGLITAHSWGTVSPTIIRATIGSASATCTVRVVSPDISVGGVDFYSDGTTAVYGITDQSGSVSTQGATEKNYNIKWDGSTLTLRDATIIRDNGNGIEDESAGMDRLVIEGTNTITATEQNSRGILDRGNLTISGSGSLDVTGSRWGLNVSRAVTIESGTIHAKGTSTSGDGIEFGGPMIINGGNVTADGGLYGIVRNGGSGAYGFTINGGTVQATGEDSGIFLYDGYSEGHVDINGGRIEVSGGTYGIYNYRGSIDISGGVVVASGTLQASSGVVISPTEGTAIAVMAGTNAENATALEGSPFEKETIIDDLLSDIKYVHTEVIEPAPSITAHPQSITVTEGQQATFSVAATGNGLSYQWQQRTDGTDWADISGANNAVYTTDAITLSMNGTQYRCIVKGAGGSVTSDAAILTVQETTEAVDPPEPSEPSTPPSRPTTPSEPEPPSGPSTVDSEGWDSICEEITNAEEGDSVVIDMGETSEVPAAVFEEVAGMDVDLTFDLGDGVRWSVNGTDIPADANLSDLDLGVEMNSDGIPANVINAITGELGTVQLTLAHDGDFGFTMTLTAPLGVENAGYWANLYHYNEVDGRMDFEAAVLIDEDGKAALPMSHASQYAIVIDDHSHAVEAALPFTDVNDNDWFSDVVRYVYEQGLMTGTSDTEFSPNLTTTRGMIVSILNRLEDGPTAEVAGFTDVADGDWYADAVNWAASEGIVAGYEDNTFRPNDPITREQLAAMLMNYAAWKGEDVSARADLSSYNDAASVSSWAAETVQWAVAEGLISGMPGNLLEPQGSATRAQVAAILERFLGE